MDILVIQNGNKYEIRGRNRYEDRVDMYIRIPIPIPNLKNRVLPIQGPCRNSMSKSGRIQTIPVRIDLFGILELIIYIRTPIIVVLILHD